MDKFTRISVQKAHELIQSGPVTIVDVRAPDAFKEGHMPQAKSIDDANIEEFLQQANKQQPLICYCYHGHSSQRAASFFASQGFQEVYSMDGGWEEWKTTYA